MRLLKTKSNVCCITPPPHASAKEKREITATHSNVMPAPVQETAIALLHTLYMALLISIEECALCSNNQCDTNLFRCWL